MKLFLSYRRKDSEAETRSIQQKFDHVPDIKGVFLDHDSIPIGSDFKTEISRAVRRSSAVLVIIGRNWVGLDPATGERRIDDPRDFVRLEVIEALASKRRVIPILMNDASMPDPASLPEEVRGVTALNAARVRFEDFEEDMDDVLDVVFGSRPRVSRWSAPRMTPFRALSHVLYGIFAAAVLLIALALTNRATGGTDLFGLLKTIIPIEDGYLVVLLHLLLDAFLIGAAAPFIYRWFKVRRQR